MNFASKIILNIYSILILVMILHQIIQRENQSSKTDKIYKQIVIFSIIMLIIDITSRFDGSGNPLYEVLNHGTNFLLFAFNLVIPSLWLLYVHTRVYDEQIRNKNLSYFLWGVNIVNTILITISLKYGWIYYIDKNNIYHRGPYYAVTVIATIILVVAAFVLIYKNKQAIPKRHYFALQFFAVPPILGVVIQTLFYNVAIGYNTLALSVLLVFLNIQRISLNTDYLTGISNRSNFEKALGDKILKASKSNSFSGIMIDLDDFKSINDQYGHLIGDEALKDAAKILLNSTKSNDILARLGGDEFVLILDVNDPDRLELIVDRIRKSVDFYNETSDMPYKLKFSIGYDVYDPASKMTGEEFTHHIDTLMYKDKQK